MFAPFRNCVMAIFKKSSRMRSSRPFYKRSEFWRRLFPVGLVLLVLGVFGGFWFLSQLGPQDVDYRDVEVAESRSADVAALQQQSDLLEQQFNSILKSREPLQRDIELLKQAFDLQVEYLKGIPSFDAAAELRRDELEKRYQDLLAAQLLADSTAAELEAESAADAGDYAQAGAKYAEAYQLQQQINESMPLSSAYSVGRVARLERRVRFFHAEPLYHQTVQLELAAEAFNVDQNWAAAEESLMAAIAIQDDLNRDYRGMKQASVLRLEQLKAKLSEARAGQSVLEVDRVTNQASAKQALGESLEAASLYQEAARLQAIMNEAHPFSAFASSARLGALQRKKQSMESFELGREIERDNELLIRLLRERRILEATEVLASLRRNLLQMKETFPLSSLNDEELSAKVNYLNFVQSDVRFIQDQVDQNVLPVPDADGVSMLKTEVPQALYELIMGTNPSRDRSGVKPVDSVSWMETQTFCERLSWILGLSVRLPREHEFRQALGPLRYLVLEEYVWSAADAEGAAHVIAQKKPYSSGYYDLLGNLSEWLESSEGLQDESVRHIGGDFQSQLETIFTVPVAEMPRRGRSRTVGFRFVVQGS
jgi:hypothetical protein